MFHYSRVYTCEEEYYQQYLPEEFKMKELRTDMELAIISSVNQEMGGVKHRLCQWHMQQALSRRLNSKGSSGYRVLNETVMKAKMPSLYNILQTLPVIPIRKKKQNLLLLQMIDKERRKVKKKFGKTSLLYVELARFLEYLELTYLDHTNASFNPRNWAAENITAGEAFIVTSLNESVNSVINTYVKKNSSEINQARGFQQVQLRYILNEDFRQFNSTKKKKKRVVVVRNILFRQLYLKIETLKLDKEDGTLDENNGKLYKSMVRELCKVQKLAKMIVKRDNDGNDNNFQLWVRSHLDAFPEDKPFMSSYLRDESIPLIQIDELLKSLEENTIEKKVDNFKRKNFRKQIDNQKSVTESQTHSSPKAKRQKISRVSVNNSICINSDTPEKKAVTQSNQAESSSIKPNQAQSLPKRKLSFTGKKDLCSNLNIDR